MQATKVQFSPEEMAVMADSAWILTKNAVTGKLYEGMGHLAGSMKEIVQLHAAFLPDELVQSNAKISKGENYGGLPYIMLDYPRVFGRTDIFAIRTFFWWGKFCTLALHVKGKYLLRTLPHILSAATMLHSNNFYCSYSGDEWNHDITTNDYAPVINLVSWGSSQTLHSSPFLKLSARVNLAQWNDMEEELHALFKVLVKDVFIAS